MNIETPQGPQAWQGAVLGHTHFASTLTASHPHVKSQVQKGLGMTGLGTGRDRLFKVPPQS